MFSVVGALIVLLVVSIGYGQLLAKASRIQREELAVHELTLAGLCVLVGCALGLLTVCPLQGVAGMSLLGVGFIFGVRELWARARVQSLSRVVGVVCIAAAILVYVAWPVASRLSFEAYDTELYHLQQVKWMRLQGTPLGLANLHSRLGVQSSYLVLAALMEQGVLVGRSAWFMPLAVSVLGMWWCFVTVWRSALRDEDRVLLVYGVVSASFLLSQVLLASPSLYQDSPVGVVQIVLVGEVLRLLGMRTQSDDSVRRVKSLVLLLAVFCATIKLSSAAVVAGAVMIVALWRPGCIPSAAALGVAGITVALFLVRNIMLSGWVFFPAPFGQLGVDWALPAGQAGVLDHHQAMQTVLGNYEIIRAWARLPGAEYHRAVSEGFAAWWPTWFAGFSRSGEARLLCYSCVASFVGTLCMESRRNVLDLAVVIVLGFMPIGYWFVSAPDLRFGGANFWILWALSLSFVVRRIPVPARLLWIFPAAWLVWSWWPAFQRTGVPQWFLSGAAVAYPVTTKSTSQGVSINVPLVAGEDRCGDAPLPCTPYFRERLVVEQRGERYTAFKMPG